MNEQVDGTSQSLPKRVIFMRKIMNQYFFFDLKSHLLTIRSDYPTFVQSDSPFWTSVGSVVNDHFGWAVTFVYERWHRMELSSQSTELSWIMKMATFTYHSFAKSRWSKESLRVPSRFLLSSCLCDRPWISSSVSRKIDNHMSNLKSLGAVLLESNSKTQFIDESVFDAMVELHFVFRLKSSANSAWVMTNES
jgi:hypothetical protein